MRKFMSILQYLFFEQIHQLDFDFVPGKNLNSEPVLFSIINIRLSDVVSNFNNVPI